MEFHCDNITGQNALKICCYISSWEKVSTPQFRIGEESRRGFIGNNMVTNRLDRTGSLSGDSKETVSFKKSDMQFGKNS